MQGVFDNVAPFVVNFGAQGPPLNQVYQSDSYKLPAWIKIKIKKFNSIEQEEGNIRFYRVTLGQDKENYPVPEPSFLERLENQRVIIGKAPMWVTTVFSEEGFWLGGVFMDGTWAINHQFS